MPLDQIIVAVVVIGVFIAFVREWFSPEMVAMGGFVVLMLTGILDVDTGFGVFASKAPIVIGCMFILSAALERTGAIEALGNRFEKLAGKEEGRVLLVLLLISAPLSAFVTNTPVVVVFMPIILAIARKHNLVATKFLIPLSYATIVGGTCTIIGTSTNLIAADIAERSELVEIEKFGMFEITPLGVVFVGVTVAYLLIFGRRLLPERTTLSTLFESEEGKEFLTQALVQVDSPLIGMTVAETPLAKSRHVRVMEVSRGGRAIRRDLKDIVIEEGDSLVLKSHAGGMIDVKESEGLAISGSEDLGLQNIRTESTVLMEGIVGAQSRLAGVSLKELNLRQQFGVVVLAVHRRGENLRERFEEVKLDVGDTLLVEGPVERMNALFAERDFINLSKPSQRPYRRNKAPIAVAAILSFAAFGIAPDMFGLLPFELDKEIIAIAAVLVVMFSGCIDRREAYAAIDWKIVFMIFGMLGIGLAVTKTELAASIANSLVGVVGGLGPVAVLALVYLLAAILTELISNHAVAAILTPLAIGIAVAMPNGGVDPRPFVIAVMFGASASFSTPIGYQTNTYVYGAGGYRFTDFARVGVPLAVALWIIAVFLIPIIWPF
ncbi:MAG: SLC13 family permease [Verrucomicrobiota bacterium]